MALSNIRVEPRREITESLVGIALVVGFLFGDYLTGIWFSHHDESHSIALGMVVGPMMLAVVIVVSAMILYLTHFLGEVLLDFMADTVGLELRPKQRYIRNYDGKIRKA